MLGVNVAVVQSGRILLTKREDFEIWCLPGGQVDPGESAAQAAIREIREEVGLEVMLTRLVGLYSLPEQRVGADHIVLFRADPVGGSLQLDPHEVLEAAYFAPEKLPTPLLRGHGQRIQDALGGVGGAVARSQHIVWPFESQMTRAEIYQLRDRSGLSRQEFFLKYFGQSGPHDSTLEVGEP